MKSLSSTKRRLVAVLALLAVGALAWAGVALADGVAADGDGVAPVESNPMEFGNVDCDETAGPEEALVAVFRSGAADSNKFQNDSTVTFSVTGTTGDVASADITGSNQVTLPSNWEDQSNQFRSNAVTSDVTIHPTEEGPGSGTVTYQASGINALGDPITRSDTMTVNWTAGACSAPPACDADLEAAVQQPINENGTSVFKHGSTVPVKIAVTDPCDDDAAVSGLTDLRLKHSLKSSVEVPDQGEINESDSQSAATTGSLFRETEVEGTYIFNLATKDMAGGQHFLRFEQNGTLLGEVEIGLTAPPVAKGKK